MSFSTDTTDSIVARVISTWRDSGRPDAEEFLSRHPALQQHKSLVLDLAYEEYCLRTEAGEQVAASTFCDRFPSYRRSLRRLIDVHDNFEQEPELAGCVADHPWPEPGSEFLGFELIEELGRGAFARVFRAVQPALGRRNVVVKVSRFGAGEAETLGRLVHQNIVPVHSVSMDEETGMTAICMPYLGHGTLYDLLDTRFGGRPCRRDAQLILDVGRRESVLAAVPSTQLNADPRLKRFGYEAGVVHLMSQLADALHYAHSMGVCHRDLKPSNILLSPAGRPLLLDFNLSSDTEFDHRLVGGTLPYMPPEQLQATVLDEPTDRPSGDPRWDIFSLGVLLYELLGGTLPFGDRVSEDPQQAAQQLLDCQKKGCPGIRTLNPLINAPLAAVVHECLNYDPDRRPAKAEELARRLRAQLSPLAELQRWARRRRLLLAYTGTVIGLGGAGLAVFLGTRLPKSERDYLAGIRAFGGGRWNAAADFFTRSYQEDPQRYPPLFARGQVRALQRRYEEALADLRQVERRIKRPEVLEWLAYCLIRQGNSVAASPHLSQIADLPGHQTARLWNNRGYVYRKRGVRQRAIQCFDRALEIDSNCWQAYQNRARVRSDAIAAHETESSGNGKASVADIRQAIRLGPENCRLFYDGGIILYRYEKSAAGQREAIRLLGEAIRTGIDRDLVVRRSGLDDVVVRALERWNDGARAPDPSDSKPAIQEDACLMTPECCFP